MPENRLALETSPYLLQHKDNPVDWRVWSFDLLAEAQRLDKPILLSIGYAACHWCHVMAHESFKNPAIAGLMNDLFLCVKVDREERPDLDALYQAALGLLGQQGGWPLTMFLTPKGEPFWGGTYFPPTDRWGRPGFPSLLRTIAESYRRAPAKIAESVETLRHSLERLAMAQAPAALFPDAGLTAATHLLRIVDGVDGGLSGAPKFPQVPLFALLWRAWRRSGNAAFRNAVLVTLERMSQGGIYDHLGGGFARYATDPQWLVPHFEKMLYDNAQLIELLTLVWQEERSALFSERVAETVAWALRDMAALGGAFAGSLDADSEGEEGRFHVWDIDEIDALLGDDSALFRRVYDVRRGGNWDGHTILNRSKGPQSLDAEAEAVLARCRAILWRHREHRVHPGRDDKVLADWNGLMIAAMANAGAVFGQPAWVDSARAAFAFVRENLGDGVRLFHSWRAGQARHPGILDDYAQMARAALILHEVTGDDSYIDQAMSWVGTVDARFTDGQGAYYLAADDVPDLLFRPRSGSDGATPPGNAIMVEVLARLYYLTGKDSYRETAEKVLAAFASATAENPYSHGSILNAAGYLTEAVSIVLVGASEEPGWAALRHAAFDTSLPNRLVHPILDTSRLPQGHPAHGKARLGSRPTAYVCTGQSCAPPVTEPEALAEQLRGL